MSQTEPDISVIRQTLRNYCDNYIHDSLPTYLLDVSRIQVQVHPTGRTICQLGDIKLVSRNQISKRILMQVEADLKAIPQIGREKWCQVGCP